MIFKLETVLTILTGVSFERGLHNAKKLIEHMSGEEATELTFLTRVRPEICKQEILKQYPNLTPFTTMTNINKDNYQDVLWSAIETIGDDEISLKPIENMPTPSEYLSSL